MIIHYSYLGKMGDDEIVDENNIVKTDKAIPNATASADVPASIIGGSQNDSQRLSYSVFLLNSLFLTPETDCEKFAIASVILSVNVNISIANLSEGVLLTFQMQEQVYIIRIHVVGHGINASRIPEGILIYIYII